MLDAIMWSMLGAITHIYQKIGFPQAEIEQARDDMMMRSNEATRLGAQRPR
jgi:hypothetical protein